MKRKTEQSAKVNKQRIVLASGEWEAFMRTLGEVNEERASVIRNIG